jgi:hypothetical protein
MKTTLILIAVLAQLGAWSKSPDDPNYRLEDRFHEIYKKFNEAPVSDENWSKVYRSSQPREYVVVKTDTLWDISQVLFADPVFWPKIWSFNTDEIFNPHEIIPGWKIRFYPGTMEAPPALDVVEYEGIVIPPKKITASATDVPPSLPDYIPEVPKFELPKLVKSDRSAINIIPPMPLPVELLRDRPDYKGRIVEIEEGSKLADYGREIFVEMEENSIPGKYTVIKNIEKNKYGFIVQYRAEIEVIEKINDSENVYRARILKMLDSVELGDRLILGVIPMVDISDKPKVVAAPFVRIIGGFRSPTDLLFSPYSIVFLDGGAREGFLEGDVMNIYQEPKSRVSFTKQKKSYREIGTIKIIRIQENVSTAYILTSKTEIREGDFAGLENTDPGSELNLDDGNLNLE